jgi:hypothetical protein
MIVFVGPVFNRQGVPFFNDAHSGNGGNVFQSSRATTGGRNGRAR